MTTTTTPTAEDITHLFREFEKANPTAALDLAEELFSGTGTHAPELIVGTRPNPIAPGGVVPFMTCPHCGEEPTILNAVDYAVRWNRTLLTDEHFTEQHVWFSYDDGCGDFQTVTVKAGCCDGVVSLPDGWEQD